MLLSRPDEFDVVALGLCVLFVVVTEMRRHWRVEKLVEKLVKIEKGRRTPTEAERLDLMGLQHRRTSPVASERT